MVHFENFFKNKEREKKEKLIRVGNALIDAVKINNKSVQLKILNLLHKLVDLEQIINNGYTYQEIRLNFKKFKSVFPEGKEKEAHDWFYHLMRYFDVEKKGVIIWIEDIEGLIRWLEEQINSEFLEECKYKEQVKEIFNKFIKDISNQKKIVFYPIVGIGYDESFNVVIYFNKFFIPFLLISKTLKQYTRLNISSMLELSRSSSVRLYEVAKKWVKIGSFKLTKEEIYYLFGLVKKENNTIQLKPYPFAYLKAYYLKPAVKEINEKTEIEIDYQLIREGKKLIEVQFTVKEKQESKLGKLRKEVSQIQPQNQVQNQKQGQGRVKGKVSKELIEKARNELKEIYGLIKKDNGYLNKHEVLEKMKKIIIDYRIPIEYIKKYYEVYGDLEEIYELLERADRGKVFSPSSILKTKLEAEGVHVEEDRELNLVARKLLENKIQGVEKEKEKEKIKLENLKNLAVRLSKEIPKEVHKEILEKVLKREFPKKYTIRQALEIENAFFNDLTTLELLIFEIEQKRKELEEFKLKELEKELENVDLSDLEFSFS